MLGTVLAAAPAAAGEPEYADFKFANTLHKWSVKNWQIFALPDHVCVAILHIPIGPPKNFWGFRVTNGSNVVMFFGPIDNAKPQNVQIEYNDDRPITYSASVDSMAGYQAYVVPLDLSDLWAFLDDLSFDAYVGGDKIFWSGTHSMGKVAEALEKCDNWQDAQ